MKNEMKDELALTGNKADGNNQYENGNEKNEAIILSVKRWLDVFVVNMNLCPFAKSELIKERVRFSVVNVLTESDLLFSLNNELNLLNDDPLIETTLLIHPKVLDNFFDYNDFLSDVNQLVLELGFEGVFQIASFHPNYQFGGTDADDAENYTNRSPYPILHILREESLERAIALHPDVEKIPSNNIALMNSLEPNSLRKLFESVFE